RHSRHSRCDLLEQFQPFPSHSGLIKGEAGNVAAWTSEARDEATGNRVGYVRDHDGNCMRLADKRASHGRGHTEDCVGSQIDQLFCECLHLIRIIAGPAKLDPEIVALRPPQLRERGAEYRDPRLHRRIAFRKADQHANAPHRVKLLRPRRQWPCRRRAAEQCDELAAPDHSITSSARASSVGGTVTPNAFAVFRLMTNSY